MTVNNMTSFHALYSISRPLAMLYNQMLSVGHVPTGCVQLSSPFSKKGVAYRLENYRPISLTCVPSKILERIISQKIQIHMLLIIYCIPVSRAFVDKNPQP